MKKLLFSLPFVTMLVPAWAQTNVFPTTGKAGIGTTSPTKQLDIHGDGINLESTTFANPSGIIFKGGTPFISNFNYGDNGTVTTAGGNTFVGFNAGNFTMGSTAVNPFEGSYNTAMGNATLQANTTGHQNTATGYASLYKNTTGSSNTATGYEALLNNTTGLNNTANGYGSLLKNTTGGHNSGFGYGTLYSNTAGNGNTASGYASLYNLSSGSYNVAYGFQSGRYLQDGSSYNTNSGTSVFIGSYTKAQGPTDNNDIVIGYNAVGAGSNSVVLGNTSITKTLLQGNVGIGTSNPESALAVNGTVTAQKVKVTLTGWPDYVFDSLYHLPSLPSLHAYITQHQHLPDIPTAVEIDQAGLDLGEMQRLQMKKVEELTLYLIEINKKLSKLESQVQHLTDSNRALKEKLDNLDDTE